MVVVVKAGFLPPLYFMNLSVHQFI